MCRAVLLDLNQIISFQQNELRYNPYLPGYLRDLASCKVMLGLVWPFEWGAKNRETLLVSLKKILSAGKCPDFHVLCMEDRERPERLWEIKRTYNILLPFSDFYTSAEVEVQFAKLAGLSISYFPQEILPS
jgi:hypothetical protein